MKRCVQCGCPVEEARECYAVPVCYKCLPPPEPLPVARFRTDNSAVITECERTINALREALTQHEESTRLLCDLAERTMITVRDTDGCDPIGLSSGPNSKHREVLEHLIAVGKMTEMVTYGRELHAAWVAEGVKG